MFESPQQGNGLGVRNPMLGQHIGKIAPTQPPANGRVLNAVAAAHSYVEELAGAINALETPDRRRAQT